LTVVKGRCLPTVFGGPTPESGFVRKEASTVFTHEFAGVGVQKSGEKPARLLIPREI
jgi:hypothetical protein